ncbi:unnamed protein product [Symbiodinium sp. CCMP2592]|nr:unnamed protein product [Symbiodinium sp. CCMP2592]
MSYSVNVKGTVSMSSGKVSLVLEHDAPQAPRPGAPDVHTKVTNIRDMIKGKISNGTIMVHESRQPLTDCNLSTMICHAQEKQKFHATGSFGMWNESAGKALVTALLRGKRTSKQSTSTSIKAVEHANALDAIKSFNVQQLNTPVFLEQSGTSGEISDLPLKEPSSQTQAKLFFDIIENIHRDAVKLPLLQSCLVENRYDDLPDFVRPKKPLPVPYKMQIAIKCTSAIHCTVLKYYYCTAKMSLSAVDDYIVGKAYLVDLAPSYKAKEPKEKKPASTLQTGFDFIRSEGPRTNIGNRQVEWTEIEVNRTDGPLSGWSTGLVKECLRNHSKTQVYAKPQTDFYLTLHGVAGWFLDDVLVNILGDLQNKTLVMMGFAEKGKTPVAQAIAMAMSEYHIIRNSKEKEMQPSFRLCASLDQLRGDSGCVERPDILDDPDTNYHASSVEAEVLPRLNTTARFVRSQLRIICDNRVNEDAEPSKGTGYVSLKAFMDMIQPAFPDKASKQDIMACLKRSHWVVNLRQGVYLRPAGTSNDDVMCISCTDGVDDFISPEGKKVMALMKDGCKIPPPDWTTKRQWSHDLLSMLIEHRNKALPRFLGSHMPRLPWGITWRGIVGRWRLQPTDTLPQELIKVKEEVESANSFPGVLAGSMPGVIDLDSPSPTPTKRRKRSMSEMNVVSADNYFPQVGADPED